MKIENKEWIDQVLDTAPTSLKNVYEEKHLNGKFLVAMRREHEGTLKELKTNNFLTLFCPVWGTVSTLITLFMLLIKFPGINRWLYVSIALTPAILSGVSAYLIGRRRVKLSKIRDLLTIELNKFMLAVTALNPLGMGYGSIRQQNEQLASNVIQAELQFKKVRFGANQPVSGIVAAGMEVMNRSADFEKHWSAMADFELIPSTTKKNDVFEKALLQLKSTMPAGYFQ
jgi:hypothetical protein